MSRSYNLGIVISATDHATKVLSRVSSRVKLMESKISNAAAATAAVGAKSLAAGAAIGYGLSKPIKAAMDFESAMADVKKVVNFDGVADFKNFSNDLLDMSRRLPLSAEGLAAIAAAGGQLGIAKGKILGFTEVVAKMSTAFDMMPEEAGDTIAKLMNVYKLGLEEVESVGDMINHLSDNTAAKARDITNVMKNIGGSASGMGLSIKMTAALSDAMLALGEPVERASNGLRVLFTKLQTAEKGGKKFQKALHKIGLSGRQLKKMLKKDADKALLDVIKRIKSLPKDQRMGVLVDIVGLEHAEKISKLVDRSEKLDEALRLVENRMNYAGSMAKEFQNRAATTANKFQLLKNSLTAVSINLGSVFLPPLSKAMEKIRGMTDRMGDWAASHPKLSKAVGMATVKFVGLLFAVGSAAIALSIVTKAAALLLKPFRLAFGVVIGLGKAFVWLSRVAVLRVAGLANVIRSVGLLGAGIMAAGAGFVWLNHEIAKMSKKDIDSKRVMGKGVETLRKQEEYILKRLAEKKKELAEAPAPTGWFAEAKKARIKAIQADIRKWESRLRHTRTQREKIERGVEKAPEKPGDPEWMKKATAVFEKMSGYMEQGKQIYAQAATAYHEIIGDRPSRESLMSMGIAGVSSMTIAAAQVPSPQSITVPAPTVMMEAPKVSVPDAPKMPAEYPAMPKLQQVEVQARENSQNIKAEVEALKSQYQAQAATVKTLANRPEQNTYYVTINATTVPMSPAGVERVVMDGIKRANDQKSTRSMRDDS